MEELIVLTKSTKISFNLYLFLILSVVSFSVFAGADPEEVTLEEEMQMQQEVKKDIVKKQDSMQVKSLEETVVSVSCISFPEAIAFKEHFACKSDIEKFRLTRLNWNFARLMLRD